MRCVPWQILSFCAAAPAFLSPASGTWYSLLPFHLSTSFISLLPYRFRLLKMTGTTGVQSHLLLDYGARCHP